MKKTFLDPELRITWFACEDVCSTSATDVTVDLNDVDGWGENKD